MLEQKQPLSISNSNPLKRKKILVGTLLFLMLFLLLQYGFGELLNPGTYKSSFHPRLRWEEYYRSDKNFDLIFLGSSHAYRSFDPAIFDSKLSTGGTALQSFNLGSSNQNPTDSYFALKEALRFHKPKLVVLEQYYVVASGDDYDFTSASYGFDYMKWSMNKLQCLINEFEPKDYIKALFKSVRYKDHWSDGKILGQNLARFRQTFLGYFGRQSVKATPEASAEGELYRGRGYVSNDGIASHSELTTHNKFLGYGSLKWSKRKLAYDRKILELCLKKGIKVLMVTAPFPPSSIKLIKNYPALHSVYARLSEQYGVKYIDYNLLNPNGSVFTDADFKDSDHLNSTGVGILDGLMLRPVADLLK